MGTNEANEPRLEGRTHGSPQRPAGWVTGSALSFELDAELRRLREEPSYAEGERNARTLVHEPDFRIVLVALKAGGRMERHTAPARISIHCLKGRISVSLEAERFDLPPGGLLTLGARVPHEVEASEEGAFLLTIGARAAEAVQSREEAR
jgi:quercetin dioxygenase-like cupin family protein